MMHILCSTDKNYIMPTGVMVKSVSVNNTDEEIIFHIIVDESVNWWHKHQLCSVVKGNNRHSIEFHVFDEDWMNFYPQIGSVKGNYLTKATYYRLLVTKMLPEDIDRIIYLDSDIVVNDSLSFLLKIDLSGNAVACVTDMSESLHDYNRLGYEKNYGYFNAGVLLINLKYWREQNVIDDFMDIILRHSDRIKYHDQDILNMVFYLKKKSLPLEYNLQNGFLYKKELMEVDYNKYQHAIECAIAKAVVIHYSSSIKPWHIECDHPLIAVWLKYRDMTRWKRKKLNRKYSIPFKSKVGNLLRKCHIKSPLPKEIRSSRYITLS